MMRDLRDGIVLGFVLVCTTVLCGCASVPNDLRARMEENTPSAAEGMRQTQFAHIGTIEAPEGKFHIAYQRLVIEGMLAPRGKANIHMFDQDGTWVKTYWVNANCVPLWAEGARVYMFGYVNIAGIPIDPRVLAITDQDEMPTGNVIDFSAGIHQPIITREKRYGSSGGIECDPWSSE